MTKELKRRYFNAEMLMWLAGALFTEGVMLTFYVQSLKKSLYGSACVIDAYNCVSQKLVFPLIMIVTALASQRMLKCDRDPMIILKYSSKLGIYARQAICVFIFSVVVSFIYETFAYVYGLIKIDIYFNWNDRYSYFAMSNYGATTDLVSPGKIIIVNYCVMVMLMTMTCLLGIIFEMIFKSDTVAAAAIVIFCSLDTFLPFVYHKLLVYESIWLRGNAWMEKIAECVFLTAACLLLGFILQGKREYYEYKKEATS